MAISTAKGSKPASLGRYEASISKIHQLLDLKDSKASRKHET